jgi:hypothetical protein
MTRQTKLDLTICAILASLGIITLIHLGTTGAYDEIARDAQALWSNVVG